MCSSLHNVEYNLRTLFFRVYEINIDYKVWITQNNGKYLFIMIRYNMFYAPYFAIISQ